MQLPQICAPWSKPAVAAIQDAIAAAEAAEATKRQREQDALTAALLAREKERRVVADAESDEEEEEAAVMTRPAKRLKVRGSSTICGWNMGFILHMW